MKSQTTLTRRQFLKGSLGTSLVLAFQLSGCQTEPSTGPDQTATSSGAFRLNIFVGINSDNTITITVPRAEMGQGVRTSMPMIVAEELDADWTNVRVEQAPAGPAYGDQYTGGSTSISTYWQSLREAGTTARAMLVAAAAQTWNVDAQECITEKSVVIHQKSGQQITYGELAEAASQMSPPDPAGLTLKDPKNFKIIGTALGQIDNSHFVDGSAHFGLDIKVPNMLYAVIARCPVFGGKLTGFEAAAARAVEGVRDVVEIENAVAVVAENTWAAMQGREALEVTWDEGSNTALSSDSIRQDILDNLPASIRTGSVQNEDKIEALYEVPYLAHATMEPMNCVAETYWNGCEIWAPTQNPQGAQDIGHLPVGGKVLRFINRKLDLPSDVVKVNVTLMGGGFGRRLMLDYVGEAVQVSQAVGAPVQVVWTREDDIQHDYYHPFSCHHVSATLDSMAEIKQQPYYGPADFPTGPWRSVEHFTQAFVQECFVDELATALARDPYELRLERIEEPRRRAVLELAAAQGNWGSSLPAGWGRGIASYSTWGTTQAATVAEVSVGEDGRMRVQRVVCAIDCGIVVNPDTVKAQVEGGVVFALSAVLKSRITLENGRIQQSNFHNYPVLRIDEMPIIEVHIVPSNEPPTGVGEMSGPPLTAAVVNAIFAATGKRIRRLPLQAEDLQQA